MKLTDSPRSRSPRDVLGELARFGLVGGVSNLIYFGVLWGLRVVRWPWWLSAGVAYAVSMVANYVLQRSFTFRSQRGHVEAGQRYVITQLIGMGVNSLTLEVLLGQRVLDAALGDSLSHVTFALGPLPAIPLRFVLGQGFAILITTVWSYISQKFWVFRA